MKMRNEGKAINGVDYDEKLRDGNYKTELTSEINDKLKTVTHTPKDKWNVPQTSNQEIGWFAEVLSFRFSKKFRKILNLCTREKAVLKLTTRTVTTRCATSPYLVISPRSDASYPLIIIKISVPRSPLSRLSHLIAQACCCRRRRPIVIVF